MRYAHEVEKVRAAERALMARLPEGAPMQRAAAGLASVCARILPRVYGARVVVLAGSGDNGGDALYAGARLARRGARVEAVPAGALTGVGPPTGDRKNAAGVGSRQGVGTSRVHQGGLDALRRAGGRVLTDAGAVDAAIEGADLVVDGLVGIGGRGGLREPYATLAERVAASTAPVVAVDVPSGVDASTGCVEGAAVRADVTVTFGTLKPGLLVDPGAAHAGVVELVDIGLGPELPEPDVVALQGSDVAALLPTPIPELDKYRRGVLGIVAGGKHFTGAAVLAVGGAVAAGVGMVRFVSTAHPVELVRHRWPEAVNTVVEPGDGEGVLAAGRVQAWAIGPGMGTDAAAASVLEAVLSTDVPVLVDADGTTLLSRHRGWLERRRAPTVLTPQQRELARLIGADPGEVEARRLEHARRAAEELGATVLLKGSTTVVAEPGRPARVNATGTPRLATAGSGDVLTGLAGALLAIGIEPLDAASAAAYLHGLAARLAADGGPISASVVVDALPDAFRAACATQAASPASS